MSSFGGGGIAFPPPSFCTVDPALLPRECRRYLLGSIADGRRVLWYRSYGLASPSYEENYGPAACGADCSATLSFATVDQLIPLLRSSGERDVPPLCRLRTVIVSTGRLHGLTGRLFPLTGRLHGATEKLHRATGELFPLTGRLLGLTGKLHGPTGELLTLAGRLRDSTGRLCEPTGRLHGATGRSGDGVQLPGCGVQRGDSRGQRFGAAHCCYGWRPFTRRLWNCNGVCGRCGLWPHDGGGSRRPNSRPFSTKYAGDVPHARIELDARRGAECDGQRAGELRVFRRSSPLSRLLVRCTAALENSRILL